MGTPSKNPPLEIEAIIFDLGRVLIDVDFRQGIFGRYLDASGNDIEETIQTIYQDVLFQDFSTGRISIAAFYQALKRRYGLREDFAEFKSEWCNVFAPVSGMQQILLTSCKKYKTGLLSDTDPLHWNYCRENFPWLQNIKKPTLSFEIGFLKPGPEAYHKAAERVQSEPQSCLFIDDRMINVEGARKTGMKSIQFKNSEQLLKDLRFYDLILD